VLPKAQGALNLHEVFRGIDLEFFICLSSATIIGVALGQASYVGSNCVLDALCEWRANQGLPSASISLPSILDAGHVAEVMLPAGQQVWTQGAISTQEVNILLQLAMDQSLVNPTANASHLIAGIQDSHEFLDLVRDKSRLLSVVSRNLSNIFETGSEAAPQRSAKVSVKSQLSSVDDAEDAKSVVTEAVVAKIAEVMSMSVDNVSPERSVADLGVDSLVAVEFRSWMSKELDVTLVCITAVFFVCGAALC
jgi:acyl carrier protein